MINFNNYKNIIENFNDDNEKYHYYNNSEEKYEHFENNEDENYEDENYENNENDEDEIHEDENYQNENNEDENNEDETHEDFIDIKEAGKKLIGTTKKVGGKAIDIGKKTTKKVVKVAKDATSFISKFLNPFISQLGGFFKKLSSSKMIAVFLTLIIPFFGQILARLIFLNISFDKLWLLFFGIPPFTIFPAILIALGSIKKGTGIPWDYNIYIPIYINLFSGFIIKLFYDEEKAFIIKYFLLLLSFIYVYRLRSYKTCKSKSAPMTKLISNSLLTCILITVVSSILHFIPVINAVVGVIENNLPYGNLVLESISIFIVYVGLSIFNKVSPKFCKEESTISYILQLLIICGLIIYKKRLDNLI